MGPWLFKVSSSVHPGRPLSFSIRAQSTVDFPIGSHVNVLSDYKETGPEKKKKINTVTAIMSLIC